VIRSGNIRARLRKRKAKKLQNEMNELDSMLYTADYSPDEQRAIRHFLLARHVL
jgi:hypothetical protein